MASLLDISLLQNFRLLFPFILVLVIVYAGLTLTFLKERKSLAWIIAFLFAIMTLLSTLVIDSINRMVPFLVLLFVVIIFSLIAFGIFGITPDSILGNKMHGSTIGWWIFSILLIIFLGSFFSVISEQGGVPGPEEGGIIAADGTVTPLVTDKGPEQQNAFFATLFNAKVLGMIVILLVGMFTIQRLSAE